eukprot:728677-Prymnesium_polylepis.1
MFAEVGPGRTAHHKIKRRLCCSCQDGFRVVLERLFPLRLRSKKGQRAVREGSGVRSRDSQMRCEGVNSTCDSLQPNHHRTDLNRYCECLGAIVADAVERQARHRRGT